MTGNFQDFLSTGSPKEYNNPESFLQNFLSYCIKDFPETKFGLYYHAYCPEFLTFLAGSDLLSNKIPEKLSKHNNIFYQSRNILLLPVSDHEDHIHYIVTVSDWRDIQDQILPLLHNLAAFSKQLFSQIRNTQDQCDLYYANLISQITHDFNSLLNQIDREKVTLPGREYAQNMLKNFLFFVREPDIEFSSVPISEYLEGFLENVKKPTETEIELCTAKTLDVISIDVELFSVALTYILNNAFEAGTGESNRIVIDIYGMPSAQTSLLASERSGGGALRAVSVAWSIAACVSVSILPRAASSMPICTSRAR